MGRLVIFLVLLLWCTPAPAQDDPQPGPANPTSTWVNEQITAVESREDLDEAERTAIADIYRAVLDHLKNAQTHRSAAAEFKRLEEAAPDQLAAINEELATSPEAPVLTIPADPEPLSPEEASTAQLENMLAQASADLEAARQHQQTIEEDIASRQERREQIPGEIASLNQRLNTLNEQIDGRQGAEGDQQVAELARLVAERMAVEAEIESLTAETSSYGARADLVSARLERAKRRVTQADKRGDAWRPIVEARREADSAESARKLQEAAREAARKHRVLDEFAKGSAALAVRRSDSESTKRKNDAATQRDELKKDLARIKDEFRSLEGDINDLGMSRATGLLARRNLQNLPTQSQLQRLAARIERALDSVVIDLVDIDQASLEVEAVEAVVERMIGQIEAETPQANLALMESEARTLVLQRKTFLTEYSKELEQTKDIYKESLTLLRNKKRVDGTIGIIELVDRYRRYIEVRIFWVRSVSGTALPNINDAFGSMAWLFEPTAWAAGLERSFTVMTGRPYRFGAVIAMVVGLIGARYWARKELTRRAEFVSRYRTDSMVHTVVAGGLTLVHAAFWPLMVFFVAAFLLVHADHDPPEQVYAFGRGLLRALHTLVPLEMLRQLSRPDGLLDAHFGWPSAGLRRMRRWLVGLGTPLVALQVIVWSMAAQSDIAWTESIGRLAFITGELLVVLAVIIILSPSNPIVQALLARDSASVARKSRYVWYPLLIIIPLCLAILSTLGYHSTATKLDTRIVDTIFFISVILAANGMLLRWLFLAQRRIAIDEARRRLAAAADEDSKSFDEDAIDVPAMSQRTRLLFRNLLVVFFFVGLATIWTDVLPALRFLERIELYPEPGIDELASPDVFEAEQTPAEPPPETEQAESASPTPTPLPAPPVSTADPEPKAQAPPFRLSAADVGAALVTLVITFFIFQNFPAFVEIALLQRLPMDAGSRYALSTILKYVIAITGSIVMFGALGLSWSQVQWLAAALTFGLAFGLQEIVANFVSGLIMLVERPVRVGDTVTVGGVSGTVTRIRMRATTILDWDRKELVIPNKTFITSQVINWTLSDTILRIICPVGVAYHSDVDKVRRTLLSVAQSHERILKEPGARALFRKFDENALLFELRFFVPHIDDLLSVTDDMHTAITEAFREANIEIAYQKLDIHMRQTSDIGGLVKPMTREQAEKEED